MNIVIVSFKLHPSCYLMKSKFPIHNIWKDEKDGGKIIMKENYEEFLLIERCNLDNFIHKIVKNRIFILVLYKKKISCI